MAVLTRETHWKNRNFMEFSMGFNNKNPDVATSEVAFNIVGL